MKKEEIILRKTMDGFFVFYSPNRKFKSKRYKTRELRDKAIDKYLEDELNRQKEAEAIRKKEWDLTHG